MGQGAVGRGQGNAPDKIKERVVADEEHIQGIFGAICYLFYNTSDDNRKPFASRDRLLVQTRELPLPVLSIRSMNTGTLTVI